MLNSYHISRIQTIANLSILAFDVNLRDTSIGRSLGDMLNLVLICKSANKLVTPY